MPFPRFPRFAVPPYPRHTHRSRRHGGTRLEVLRPLLQAGLALGLLAANPLLALDHPVVISAYQGPCQDGDFDANLATARRLTREALQRGSHFLLLPECFLSGYADRESVHRGARPLSDAGLGSFITESADHEMVILAGLARREGTHLFNSVLVIQHGRLLGRYDKVLLTGSDRNELGFSAGTTVPVFEAHGARFGVVICADSSYPHPALAARLQGAEILFSPHYNFITAGAADDHRHWVRNCHIGLACQLQMAVARANVTRTDRPGDVSFGDSFILSPQGVPLAEAGLFRTGLITATLNPGHFRAPHVWANLDDTPGWLRRQVANLLTEFRPPTSDADLRRWLENLVVFHRFTTTEASIATGLTVSQVDDACRRWGLAPRPIPPPGPGETLRVLPYPGGRHPRRGFFEGAIAPQRETKVSVFTPWADGGYLVVDVPEAIFSNLGLTYLAHTHIPTLWDDQGITLPRREWAREPTTGAWVADRELPNGIAFGARVEPGTDGVRFLLWLRNGTAERLSGLRVQNCVMLGSATGFELPSLENKVFATPWAAARSNDGGRWVLTAWERCGRTWGNELVPCLHSDPVFPDCDPGERVQVRGWLSFFEGSDVQSEFDRLTAKGLP